MVPMNRAKFMDIVLPVAARVGSAVSLFGIFILTSFLFEPDNAATVFKFQVWANIASSLTQFGIPIVALRLVKHSGCSPLGVFYRSLAIIAIPIFIWPFATLMGLWFGDYFNGKSVGSEILVLYTAMVLGHAFCQIEADLYRALNFNRASSFIILAPALLTFLFALLYSRHLTTSQLIAMLALSHLVIGIGGAVAYFVFQKQFLRRVKLVLLQQYIRSTLRQGYIAFSTSILSIASTQVDQAIMSRLATPAVFAQYATAVRLAQVFNVLINSLNPIATTHALRLFVSAGRKEVELFLKRYTQALAAISFCGVATFSFLVSYFLPLLRGTFESFAVIPSLCLAVPALVNLITGPKGYLLWVFGYESTIKKVLLMTTIVISGSVLSYYFTENLVITTGLVGGALLAQYFVEMILVKRMLRLSKNFNQPAITRLV